MRTALEQSEAEASRLRDKSVEGLSPEQVKTLLGDDFAAAQQEQLQTLRAQLAAATKEQRAAEQQLEAARAQLTATAKDSSSSDLSLMQKSTKTRVAAAAQAAQAAQAREAELE